MTDTIVPFPRRSYGLKLGVSSPEIFGEIFRELAENRHGELNPLELNMAILAASCYQGAWISHELTERYAGVAFSHVWRPTDVRPTPILLAALTACGNRPGDLPYLLQVQLLAAHAVFMQRQVMLHEPALRTLSELEGPVGCADLLDNLGFAAPFAPEAEVAEVGSVLEMFEGLQRGLTECETKKVITDDCLTLAMRAVYIAAGARAYVLTRHKAD